MWAGRKMRKILSLFPFLSKSRLFIRTGATYIISMRGAFSCGTFPSFPSLSNPAVSFSSESGGIRGGEKAEIVLLPPARREGSANEGLFFPLWKTQPSENGRAVIVRGVPQMRRIFRFRIFIEDVLFLLPVCRKFTFFRFPEGLFELRARPDKISMRFSTGTSVGKWGPAGPEIGVRKQFSTEFSQACGKLRFLQESFQQPVETAVDKRKVTSLDNPVETGRDCRGNLFPEKTHRRRISFRISSTFASKTASSAISASTFAMLECTVEWSR